MAAGKEGFVGTAVGGAAPCEGRRGQAGGGPAVALETVHASSWRSEAVELRAGGGGAQEGATDCERAKSILGILANLLHFGRMG